VDPTRETVAAVLAGPHPSFHAPLKVAWGWNRQKTPASLAAAVELLLALKERYAHALPVRYELALALVSLRRRQEALAVLKAAGDEFPVLNEDVLGLWGRICKDDGDASLAAGTVPEAYRMYSEALDKYERAFDLTGSRFPGINAATLLLVLASLDANGETQAMRKKLTVIAQRLLDGRLGWREELADDNIWIRATEAEARLVLQEWEPSAGLYRAALGQPNLQPFHVESMRKQVVERILPAFRRLRVEPAGPFTDPDALFTPPR
jgi:tetratricopeptide (TPR) repeat protein